MITMLNKKELIGTYDMDIQARIRNILSDNHIDYEVKTVNRKSASPYGAGSRVTGTFGENLDMEYEYIIYVKKTDYDTACGLIQGIR